mmetsp:Transcript_26133/g.72058  ORF Transcript_26133/g.72058 Transcript_26133/m.72058 type:complete len:213 (-) Transcript_26133:22-660(-)
MAKKRTIILSCLTPPPTMTSTFNTLPSEPSRRMARTAFLTTSSIRKSSSVDWSCFCTFLGISIIPNPSPSVSTRVDCALINKSMTLSKSALDTSLSLTWSKTSPGTMVLERSADPSGTNSFTITPPLSVPVSLSSNITPNGFSNSTVKSPRAMLLTPRRRQCRDSDSSLGVGSFDKTNASPHGRRSSATNKSAMVLIVDIGRQYSPYRSSNK